MKNRLNSVVKFFVGASVIVAVVCGSASFTFAAEPFTALTVEAGLAHTIALKNDGTVWTWGRNDLGQLGDGTTTDRYTPVQVSGLSSIVAIAAGGSHTVALKNDGSVWAWGNNEHGQLGDGTEIERSTPVQVKNLDHIIAIDAGDCQTIALKNDGTVWIWGNSKHCWLSNGSIMGSKTPVQIPSLSDIVDIAAGINHAIALKKDGTVWAWGWNNFGQLGNGPFFEDRSIPVQVLYINNVRAIDASWNYSIALLDVEGPFSISNGMVFAWGQNQNDHLYLDRMGNQSTPMPVIGINNVIEFSAGSTHIVALKSNGTVWTWGSNTYGEMGVGRAEDDACYSPGPVKNLNNVATVTAGGYHSVAIKKDGTVWAWGWNEGGQLGDGTTIDRYIPVQVMNF